MNKRIITIIIIVATLVLAGVGIFTAIRLYQLRTTTPTKTGAQVSNCGTSCTTNSQCTGGTICDPANRTCRNPQCVEDIGRCDPAGCTAVVACGKKDCNIGSSVCEQGVCKEDGTCDCSVSPSPSPSAAPSACNIQIAVLADTPTPSPTASPTPTATGSPTPTGSPTASPTATARPTGSPTAAPELPEAGVSVPAILGAGAGMLLLLGALLLAL